jgi:GxxExxY protein
LPGKTAGSGLAISPAMGMLHEEITERIIGVFYEVYNELGYGFLERICQTAMVMALTQSGLSVVQKAPFQVWFRGVPIGEFVPDLIVERRVLVELKSASMMHPWDDAQVLNYLRVSSLEVALLMNFGPKPEYRRRILTNDRKTPYRSGEQSLKIELP